MTKPIQVGDLVRIDLPEIQNDQKGLWLVVDRPDHPPFQDYYLISKGTQQLVLCKYDLEKVSE
jgi:hypothetical protein